MTTEIANSLTSHKEMRQLLYHVSQNSPTRVIGTGGAGSHIKLYFENDGLLTMSSSPSDINAVHMADRQIRKSLGSHGFEYQTMKEFKKAKKKQKDTPVEDTEQ